MTINKNAPVSVSSEIEVAADPDSLWDVLTAIDHWPDWNPEVKWASLDGAVTEGAEFRWKAGPRTITSTINRADRPRLLSWTGKTLGVNALHVWRLESQGGNTIVRTEESWEGLVVRIFGGPMQKMLKKSLDVGLRHLKAEAERRSTA